MSYHDTPFITMKTVPNATIASMVDNSNCLTPIRVANAYDVQYHSGAGLKVGIVSLDGGFQQSDLDQSLAELGITSPTINVELMHGASGNFTGSAADLENTLDVYCVAALVPDATINLYIGNLPAATDFPTYLSWYSASFQQAVDDGCDVIVHCWGVPESTLKANAASPDFLWSPFGSAQDHNVPVIVSTGDYGSAISTNTEGVLYPASSPGVIAVGGTFLQLSNKDQRELEVVENHQIDTLSPNSGIGGGGGISMSNYAPDFQVGLPYQEVNGLNNPTGTLSHRGIPDIVAAMNDYVMYFNGVLTVVSGTSASAPIVAGIIARTKGLTGVSWSAYNYNHAFYKNTKNSSLFYEIISGNNARLGAAGYFASAGWNPVSGLGAINGRSVERLVGLKGTTYPQSNFKARPTTGRTYPR